MDDVIPIDRTGKGLPSPAGDQQDAQSPRALEQKARESVAFHRQGLRARRNRDLTAEKYMLHIDGEGDSQWFDVFGGTRLAMAPRLNGVSPTSDNQLSPIIDNFVAHLTTQPYRFVVEHRQDRKSRQSAMIDQAIINAEVRSQKWNSLMAEAKLIAAAAGFCPIHSMWRDAPVDGYEVAAPGQMPGSIDSWVGNPFDTVVNAGARRGAAHRMTYARTLPAELVRAAFPGIEIEGTTRIPSASGFQRVVTKWMRQSGMTHGHAELTSGENHEELICLIYDEVLPGIDPDYPMGGLCIVALQGAATVALADTREALGKAVHLWSGPLPAGVFDAVITYSHHRFDDWHGKPYVADIDDDQMELNQRLSLLKDYQRRANRPSLGSTGELDEDTVGFEGDQVFTIDGGVGTGTQRIEWLEYPQAHVPILLNEIDMIYERMYRKAGWQAASRGEHTTGSGKAIIALQQADDSIMGPIAQRTSEELEDLAQLNWRLRKQFMDAPTILEYVGDEMAHMIEPYVDRTMMSDMPPSFRLVSQFGTSTEAQAQQLLNLLSVTDAMGVPVLSASQFKKKWPDQSLYTEVDDPADVRQRRPRVVNEMIRQAAARQSQMLAQQFPGWQPSMGDPFTEQLGMIVEMEVAQSEDVLIDDDIEQCIEILSIITQDPTEDPVARRAAIFRQQRYFMWLAGQQMQTRADGVMDQQLGAEAKQLTSGTPSTEEAFHPAPEGATGGSADMAAADKNFERQIA